MENFERDCAAAFDQMMILGVEIYSDEALAICEEYDVCPHEVEAYALENECTYDAWLNLHE